LTPCIRKLLQKALPVMLVNKWGVGFQVPTCGDENYRNELVLIWSFPLGTVTTAIL